MNNSLLWRGLLIAAIVGIALFSAYPPQDTINLGLDLRGGLHLVLEVESEDALRAEADKDIERLLEELEGSEVTGAQGNLETDNRFRVTGLGADNDALVRQITEDFLVDWTFSRSGADLVFDRRPEARSQIREQAVTQALQTIRNRVDEFGVAEPVIQQQGLGSNRLVVQLPGVDDPERVKDLIKNTAFLEFRIVDFPPNGGSVGSREEVLSQYGGNLPENVEIMTGPIRDGDGNEIAQGYYALERRSMITGRDLKTARSGVGQFNEPVVNFSLTTEGSTAFSEGTGANIGRAMAIVLDGRVQSAPVIEGRISDRGVIRGSFTPQEAEDLSLVLRSGALPAGISFLQQTAVGPSLGRDSIERGQSAGLAGLALIVLAMLIVYKGTGINAVLALLLNVVLVFGMLAYFGATLTLPGIAGIVLTIGMAVDANVLVFERIREELRAGRTVKTAVSSGFQKALSSVLDANITTLIAALFLFNFGTGPLRGFAVTLSIGVLASVFTAIFNSRWIFDLILSRRARVERLSI